MKKFLLMCIGVLLLIGCGTTDNTVIGTDGKPLSKDESAKVIRNTVESKLENRDFRILVDQMDPTYGPTLHLRDNDWALEVHNDSIGSVLPYIGRVYNVPYGSAIGFHFITRINSYTVEKVKPNMWRAKITCNTAQDFYTFVVEVYDNGSAYISANTNYRDLIRFSGDMDLRGLSLKRVK